MPGMFCLGCCSRFRGGSCRRSFRLFFQFMESVAPVRQSRLEFFTQHGCGTAAARTMPIIVGQVLSVQVLQGGNFFHPPDSIRGLAKRAAYIHSYSFVLMTIVLKRLYTDFFAGSKFLLIAIKCQVDIHAGVLIETQRAS